MPVPDRSKLRLTAKRQSKAMMPARVFIAAFVAITVAGATCTLMCDPDAHLTHA